MASKQSLLSPAERKQRKLVFVLIGIVLVTLIIVYFGYFRSNPSGSVTELITGSDTDKTQKAIKVEQGLLEKMDFDAGFLNDSQFQALRVYGEWPLDIGARGRGNPFLPY